MHDDTMPRTVIAYEDDPALNGQLESVFLTIQDEYHLLATFANPVGVLFDISHFKPDVVLMDLQMLEEDDGLVALHKIKQTSPDIKVLVLTMFDADHKVFNAICLGADGYMLKSDFSSYTIPQEAIRKSLSVIFEGGAYLTPSVAGQIMRLFTDASISARAQKVKETFQAIFNQKKGVNRLHASGLTPTQIQILQGIIDGRTSIQMARERGVTENTINSHIKTIYTVLGVHSRALAVRKAIENRWIS